jgi:NADPH:quinone reductase-like Zn-dependent oxidoreductase
MKQILQNLGNGVTTIEDVPAPGVRAGQLLIRTSASLVSAGTDGVEGFRVGDRVASSGNHVEIAEDSSRILRRTRINKMATYRDMYVAIGRKIVTGSPGDSRESILASSSLVLALEEALPTGNKNPRH